MFFIYCSSYEHIPFALYLKNNNKITIITSHEGIKKFSKLLNINVIYFKSPKKIMTINIFKQVTIFNYQKKIIKKIISKMKISNSDSFYLPTRIFNWPSAGFIACLVKKLSNKVDVYLARIEYANYKSVKIKNKFSIDYIKLGYIKVLCKIAFGVDLTIFDIDLKKYLGINGLFIKKNKLNKYVSSIKLSQLRGAVIKSQPKLFKQDYKNFLLFEGGTLNKKFIFLDSVLELYQELFNSLPNFIIKNHPSAVNYNVANENILSKLQMDGVNHYPSYIPAEFLFKNITKNVLGIISASLVTAAYQKNIKSISMLNLIKWKNNKSKNLYKEFLLNQNKRIIFPEDIDSLYQLL